MKKVCCVIMAPDLEKIKAEGGLDSAVDSIIRNLFHPMRDDPNQFHPMVDEDLYHLTFLANENNN